MKLNNKYNYVSGTRIDDHGSRTYDINGARLPSVTTILGKTKNQDFLKKWKAKVGEENAERIKNHSSQRGTAMHKFLESHVLGTGYDDLTWIGQEAKPMAKKLLKKVCSLWKNTMARKSRFIILAYMLALLTWFAITMA